MIAYCAMKWNISAKNILTTLIKILCIGLFLQFFVQTFVTFGLGWDGKWRSVLRAWKEILLLLMFLGVARYLTAHRKRTMIREVFWLQYFFWYFVGTLAVVLLVNFVFLDTQLNHLILSLKYDLSGFAIFILVVLSAQIWLKDKAWVLVNWYMKFFKALLVAGLVWRSVLWIAPKTFDFVGYNMYAFEWEVGEAPPSQYFTQLDHGFVRNQFLFERPISWGFFLVAFWPLFFVLMLKNKWMGQLITRGGCYGLNVFLTFSRAAWWAWFVITILLLLYLHRKDIWKWTIYLLLPVLALFAVTAYVGREQIITREYSNTGHKELLTQAISMIQEKPIWWQGAGTAGPVTHHRDDIAEFNPENQFLQIWIEYGVFGFIGWMLMYGWLMWRWIPAMNLLKHKKHTKSQRHSARMLFAMALGLFGLAIEGLVLHSFIDRMIVYPFMIIFALVYVYYLEETQHVLHHK